MKHTDREKGRHSGAKKAEQVRLQKECDAVLETLSPHQADPIRKCLEALEAQIKRLKGGGFSRGGRSEHQREIINDFRYQNKGGDLEGYAPGGYPDPHDD